MANRVQNIIIGAAAIWLSTIDSTDSDWVNNDGSLGPAVPAGSAGVSLVAALNASADWRHVGFTSDGIEVSYEPDYGEVQVDQLLDAAKLFKQSFKVMVNTTFAEATLENLMVAWGQQTASYTDGVTTADDILNIEAGALGDEPVERSIVFIGPAPRNTTGNKKRERVYHVRRSLSVSTTSHSLKRSDPTALPVSFRLLADPSQSGKEYGTVRDRNIEA